MTQKEKAKAYDEAIETGKALHKNGAYRLLMEEIFSELKESGDERIRKELIDFIRHSANKMPGEKFNERIAWLEKQSKENMIEALRLEYEKGKADALQEQRKEWNEEDERIRKALIHFFSNPENASFEYWEGIPKKEVLAWLEKQGEKTVIGNESNSASVSDGDTSVTSKEVVSYPTTSTTIKPKFKVGDFIVNDYCMGRVVELTNDAYLLDTEQGIPFSYEHNVHLWTIQDAKDGDIIYIKSGRNDSEWLLIFKKIERSQNNYIDVYNYYALSVITGNVYHDFNGWWGLLYDSDIVRPATKEQCDLLFQKMKEEGFEWDAEKKELKLLITNGGDFFESETCKQNSTWSEADEVKINRIVGFIENLNIPDNDILRKDAAWLKSLKERYTWKPSNEQMEALADALSLAKNCGEERAFDLRTLYEQLQKIKENKL